MNSEAGCASVVVVIPKRTAAPSDLRQRLEDARLDNLALMRALDHVFPGGPPVAAAVMRAFGELEADCAEALWALDQPAGTLDVRLMVRDTLASLARLPDACARIRAALPLSDRSELVEAEAEIRAALDPREAYSQVPGRDRDIQTPVRKVPLARVGGVRVRSNDPCPCGSGKKYKRCCAVRPPAAPVAGSPLFYFEPGSYGGPGGFFPSIKCEKGPAERRLLHFVLVKPGSLCDQADDAVEEAERDLEGAFSSGGLPERVASHLREAGYVALDDPRMARD